MEKQTESVAQKKRKQKKKPGKVIRVPKELAKLLNENRKGQETWGQCLSRLIDEGKTTETMWTLPSRLLPTREEALGQSIQEAVREKIPLQNREEPVKVREAK